MANKKPFIELQFSDAFMFAAAMEDEEICRGVLERILGIPIRKVRVRAEASLLVNPDFRGVRLDVYADDEEGTIFNVEMQTTDKRNLPRRSRAYQGQLDLVALKPGDDFNQLPRSFIIFICTYDPFGIGRYRYTYEMRCRETGDELGDEAYKIFLNTKGKDEEEEPPDLVHFLKYVENAAYSAGPDEDKLIQKIETKIAAIKQNRGMEVRYMQFSEMLSDERREGRKEGRNEERQSLFKLMDLMEADGNSAQIPLLRRDPEFLREMYGKYHLEI